MDGDLLQIVLKAFGPAGGLAVLMLGASVWANWKLVMRIIKMNDATVTSEKNHAQELVECRLECKREQTDFRDQLEKRYQEQIQRFLVLIDQHRADVGTLFSRFENLMGVITEALTKQTTALVEMKYEIKDVRHKAG